MKLILTPDAEGYTSVDGNEVIGGPLAGGAGRYRRDKIGTNKIVTVTWTMNREEYQYWRAFFVTGTQNGSLPFTCDLLSEDGMGPVEHTCQFIPGSVSLPAQSGLTYVQQATLEVTPIPHDADFDMSLITLWQYTDGAPEPLLDAIARLVNVTMPATLS